MLTKILYPLDLSPLSQKGLAWVVGHVLQDNSKVLIVHVVDPTAAGIDTPRYVHDASISIDTLCKTLIPEHIVIKIKVVAGDIMEILPETARSEECTFAVTPIKNGEAMLPLVRSMAIPHLLLRQKKDETPKDSLLKKVIIAVDLLPERTTTFLKKIEKIFSSFRAEPEIILLHGLPLDEVEVSQDLVNMAEKALDKVQSSVGEWNSDTTSELISGQPEEELPRRVGEIDPTLLVVGLDNKSELWELILGSTGRALIERTECPVLIVPLS